MRANNVALKFPISGDVDVSRAYHLHNIAKAAILGGIFQKCQSEVLIYSRFEELKEYSQKRIREQRKQRRRLEYRKSQSLLGLLKTGSAAHLALDILTRECLQSPLEEIEELDYQRNKITRLKRRGKLLTNFRYEYEQDRV